MTWRVAAASAVGSGHRATDLPNQDACWTQTLLDPSGAPCLVLVVADGAGSAAHADLGAECAVDAVGSAAVRWCMDSGRGALDEAVLDALVTRGAQALTQLAADLECAPRDLSCTLLLAVVTNDACGFAQIGDGIIVYADPLAAETAASVALAFWPQAGEYANITEFLSDPQYRRHLRSRVIAAAPRQMALSTDGLQRLALRLAEQQVHAPFFTPFWTALTALPMAEQAEFASQLRDWLGSAAVEQRTDDDKTLVLAVSIPAAASPA